MRCLRVASPVTVGSQAQELSPTPPNSISQEPCAAVPVGLTAAPNIGYIPSSAGDGGDPGTRLVRAGAATTRVRRPPEWSRPDRSDPARPHPASGPRPGRGDVRLAAGKLRGPDATEGPSQAE